MAVQPDERRRRRQTFNLATLDVCPNLRLVDDPDTHAAFARPDHACASLNAEPIPPDWQHRFCLCPEYTQCPAFQGEPGTLADQFSETNRKSASHAHEAAANATADRSPRSGARGMALLFAALLILGIVAAGIFLTSRNGIFDTDFGLWGGDPDIGEVVEPVETQTPEPTDEPSLEPIPTDEPADGATVEPAPEPTSDAVPPTPTVEATPTPEVTIAFVYRAYEDVWQRTDYPVRQGQVNRSWVWGDVPLTGPVDETWEDWEGGVRVTQYFPKGRMELDEPIDDPGNVAIGLLVVEMAEGFIRIGSDTLDDSLEPASIPIAGDGADGAFPTYAEIVELGLIGLSPHAGVNGAIMQSVVDGSVTTVQRFAAYGVTAAYFIDIPTREHMLASVFWNYMNAEDITYQGGGFLTDRMFPNTFDVTGLPITEPYWTVAQIDGEDTDVLWQCFERRCLLYIPSYEPGQRVQSTDTGLHYYQWRYGAPPQ